MNAQELERIRKLRQYIKERDVYRYIEGSYESLESYKDELITTIKAVNKELDSILESSGPEHFKSFEKQHNDFHAEHPESPCYLSKSRPGSGSEKKDHETNSRSC